jgi:hypothetical protein
MFKPRPAEQDSPVICRPTPVRRLQQFESQNSDGIVATVSQPVSEPQSSSSGLYPMGFVLEIPDTPQGLSLATSSGPERARRLKAAIHCRPWDQFVGGEAHAVMGDASCDQHGRRIVAGPS